VINSGDILGDLGALTFGQNLLLRSSGTSSSDKQLVAGIGPDPANFGR
jgi:hypothetical protein